jgi:hypothetical protein
MANIFLLLSIACLCCAFLSSFSAYHRFGFSKRASFLFTAAITTTILFVQASESAFSQCAPVIERIESSSMTFGPGETAIGGPGTGMTIYGRNFTPDARVQINGIVQNSARFLSPTVISFAVEQASDGFITVCNSCGCSSGFAFKYINTLEAPIIYDFSPKTIPAGRRSIVYVYGGGFRSTVRASINGQPINIIDRIQTNDFTVTPPMPRDTLVLDVQNCVNGLIRITNPDPLAGGAFAETVLPLQCVTPTQGAPVIDNFSPREGGPGALITITGQNLENIATVRFGRSPASVVSTQPLIVRIGDGSTGSIEITTPGGSALSRDIFTFVPRPIITSVSPTIIGPGTPVFIYGKYLLNGSVRIGNLVPETILNASDTLIVATIGTTGTITSAYSQLPALNLPLTVSARGGTGTAPETVALVLTEYSRPRLSLRPRNPQNGAQIDAATRSLFLRERRATFNPPEAEQRGEIAIEQRGWNSSVSARISISYLDSADNAITVLRGLNVTDSRRNDVLFPIPPVPPAQLPFFPQREIIPINGLWGDLLPVAGGGESNVRLDTLRFGANNVPIIAPRSTFQAILLNITPIAFRARWSDQLPPNNPERFVASDLSVPLGRQGRRKLLVQILPSPVGEYDVDAENSRATVFLDDPECAPPAVINPVEEISLFAGASDSTYIEFPSEPGFVAVRPSPNGGVLPRDIFYDDNYLPLTYSVQSDDTTKLRASLRFGAAAFGAKPYVYFTVLPAALSGSTAAIIITANNGCSAPSSHRILVRVRQGAPVVAGFQPPAANPGDIVTIRGRDFGANPIVRFAGTEAGSRVEGVVVSSSDTSLSVRVPALADNGRIEVVNAVGSGFSSEEFALVRTPRIDSFSPDSAARGALITVRGRNFRGVQRVTLGGVLAENLTVLSDSVLTAIVGAGGASGALVVANSQESATAAQRFVFFPAPVLDSLSPIVAGAGAQITLFGAEFSSEGFAAPEAVFIGDREIAPTLLSPNRLNVIVPNFGNSRRENLLVRVRTRGGETTATVRFTYVPCPTVDSFSPSSGGPLTTMRILGAGFQAVTGVRIGGVAARIWRVVSPSEIEVSVGSVESGDVEILAGSCTVAAFGRFTYQTPTRPLLLEPAQFAKTFPGDSVAGTVSVTNFSSAPLSVALAIAGDSTGNFRLSQTGAVTLARNESRQISLVFAPRSSGVKTARIQATVHNLAQGAPQHSQQFDTLQQATAGVWQVFAADFDTVRTGASTLRAARIVNRNSIAQPIESLHLESDGAFRLAGSALRWVGAGDTVAAIIRCVPGVSSQRLQSEIRVVGAQDTGAAPVTAFARAPLPEDIVVSPRFFAQKPALAPGQNVALRLELTDKNGSLTRALTANSRWQASARWNHRVLLPTLHTASETPTRFGEGVLARNSEPRNALQRINFSAQALPSPSGGASPLYALASVPCGVYYGQDSVSVLELEELVVTIGGLNGEARGRKVFVEETNPNDAFGTFTARTNGRLVKRNATATLAVISPNPAQNRVEVRFSLPYLTAIALNLIDVRGNLIKPIAGGWFDKGDHTVDFDASNIPSGSYLIILHTENDRISRPIQFVR